MRFVSWNMGRSKRTHEAAWHYLICCLRPDVAFVQEALASAEELVRPHGVLVRSHAKRAGTAVYVRHGIEFERLEPHQTLVPGSYVAAISTSVFGKPTRAVSVHVGPEKWENQVALGQWLVGQLLPSGRCVIGGDLNTSRSFSKRHNHFLEGLSAAGFYDCHFARHREERASFWGRQAKAEYQDDHIFTDQSLAQFIRSCDVMDNALTRILSDHGPLTLDVISDAG